jgi:hypothetical protein
MRNDLDINDLPFVTRLSEPEWETFRRDVIRRAHEERAKMIRHAFGALFAWLRDVVVRVWDAVSAVPRVFPSHRL